MSDILIHYDVPDGYVLLDTFVGAGVAAENVSRALGLHLFGDPDLFDVVVFAPEPGTLKQYLKVVAKIGKYSGYGGIAIWMAIQAMDSETVQKVSRALFDKEPADILVEKIETLKARLEEGGELSEADEAEAVVLMEAIVAEGAEGTFRARRDTLETSDLPEDLVYELEEAQSHFYTSVIQDIRISGIGFDASEEFPFERKDFVERAVPPRRRQDEQDELWSIDLMDLKVTSPNFARDDQRARKWKARQLVGGAFIYFELDDEAFWDMIKESQFDFGGATVMTVQMLTTIRNGRSFRHRAIKVLSVNGKAIARPLSDAEVKELLENEAISRRNGRQGSLFD